MFVYQDNAEIWVYYRFYDSNEEKFSQQGFMLAKYKSGYEATQAYIKALKREKELGFFALDDIARMISL